MSTHRRRPACLAFASTWCCMLLPVLEVDGKRAMPPANATGHVLGADPGAFVGLGETLDEAGSASLALRKPPPPPPNFMARAFKDPAMAAANFVVDAVGLIKTVAEGDEVKLQNLGSLIAGIAPAMAFAIPPPAGLIVAGVLATTGGVVQLFGEKQPSNSDVMEAMKVGFDNVNTKLDEVRKTLGGMGAQLIDMTQQMRKITEQLQGIQNLLDKVHLYQIPVLQEISRNFAVVWAEYESSINNPDFADNVVESMEEAHKKFKTERFGAGGALHSDNLRAFLGAHDMCDAGDFYLLMLSARFEMFWFENTLANLGKRGGRVESGFQAVQDLRSDLESYTGTIHAHYKHHAPWVVHRWEQTDCRSGGAAVTLKKAFHHDKGRYLTAHACDKSGCRDKMASWALGKESSSDAIEIRWELEVVQRLKLDATLVKLKKSTGRDAGRYLAAKAERWAGFRDATSSWALVHEWSDENSLWELEWIGKRFVKLKKYTGYDAGRYLTMHSTGYDMAGVRDAGSSWACVHDWDDEDSLWELEEVVNYNWQLDAWAELFAPKQ